MIFREARKGQFESRNTMARLLSDWVVLLASCKRLRIEPFAYLFKRISTHPHHRLDELLPDRWLVGQRKISSAYEET